jgi:hypothetical protein
VISRAFFIHGSTALGRDLPVHQTLRTLLLLVIFVPLFSSCVCPIKHGDVTHHVVLGFGIVSTYERTNQPVTVTRVHAVGVYVGNAPGLNVGLGACSSTVVSVSTNAEDVRVEVMNQPGSGMIVDTTSVTIHN